MLSFWVDMLLPSKIFRKLVKLFFKKQIIENCLFVPGPAERPAPKLGLIWLLYLKTPGLMEKVDSMLRVLFLLACGHPDALKHQHCSQEFSWQFALKFCVTKSKRSQKYFKNNIKKLTDQVTQGFLANSDRARKTLIFLEFELKLTGKFPWDKDKAVVLKSLTPWA